jgi:hypothetical protein
MKGSLVFGLVSAIVAGVTMAATLGFAHQLGHGWPLVLGAAGAFGAVGLALALVAHLLLRAKPQADR